MHTAEHILNQTMVRMFGCKRSMNAHIERKKSKCDYYLKESPTAVEISEIEDKVNEVIRMNLPVTVEFIPITEASKIADLSKLPEDSFEMIRIIKVGDYDVCACAGTHVQNTSEIGKFKILNHEFENSRWRMRFKLE